jgi:UDP-N-acetylmuramoyl-tripeptide--D-alanyl-D-alanine ligase
VALRLVGDHHVGNALAAAAVALELGGTPEGVAAALTAAAPSSRWRMEVTDRPDGVTVVNDAYNANPESMRAALVALESLGAGPAHLGRARPHGRAGRRLGRRPRRGDRVRPGARRRAARGRGGPRVRRRPRRPGRPRALHLLRAELAPGDAVLVKASRAAGLERLAAGLLEGES